MRHTSIVQLAFSSMIAAAVVGAACGVDLEAVPADEPCRSVGYSIASRTRVCTGDDDLAKSRYETFRSNYACVPPVSTPSTSSEVFACSVAVNALACEQVKACGDDLACWLTPLSACQVLLGGSQDGGQDVESGEAGAGGGGWGGMGGEGGAGGSGGSGGAGGAGGSGGEGGQGGEAGGAGAGGKFHPTLLLAAPDALPGGLAIDSERVYFTTRGTGVDAGKVFSVAKTGGAPTQLVAGLVCPTGGPKGLALDANDVFVALEGCDRVVRVPKSGGAATTIAEYPSSTVTQVAVYEDSLYVALGVPPKIVRMAKNGTGQADFSLLDAGAGITAFAVAGQELFWSATGTGPNLQKAPFATGTATNLATGYASAAGLALDTTDIYLVDAKPVGSVIRVPQAGGAITELSEGEPAPAGVAVDEQKVYWTRSGSGVVVARAKQGGAKELIAANQAEPGFVAVDQSYVFWTTQGTPRSVMRAEK